MREIIIGGIDRPVFVDNEDYDALVRIRWRALIKKNGTVYAVHDVRLSPTKCIRQIMHREIMHPPAGILIDHINRDGIDNQKSNLRFATNQQNCTNRVGWSNVSSKYKGVSWDTERQKWRAVLNYNGTIYRLGRFDIEEDAAIAYDNKAMEVCGEFVCLNILRG